MTSWKGAFVAVLMSGIVVGILNGHLAIWTAIGAALGAILAARQVRLLDASGKQQQRQSGPTV
jgi:hypothetical protein